MFAVSSGIRTQKLSEHALCTTIFVSNRLEGRNRFWPTSGITKTMSKRSGCSSEISTRNVPLINRVRIVRADTVRLRVHDHGSLDTHMTKHRRSSPTIQRFGLLPRQLQPVRGGGQAGVLDVLTSNPLSFGGELEEGAQSDDSKDPCIRLLFQCSSKSADLVRSDIRFEESEQSVFRGSIGTTS